MGDDDRDLLHELKLLGQTLGPFALGVLENRISRGDQLDFGTSLVTIAERIRDRASRRPSPSRARWFPTLPWHFPITRLICRILSSTSTGGREQSKCAGYPAPAAGGAA